METPYVGLITFVEENETAYICKSVGSTIGTSEWIQIKGKGSGGSNLYVCDTRPDEDPEQWDAENEGSAIWVDTHDDFTQDNIYGPEDAETIMSLRKAYFALKEQVNILNNLVTVGAVPGKVTDSARNKMRWNIPEIVPDAYVESLMNDGFLYDRRTGNIYEYIPEFGADGSIKSPYDENGYIINMPSDNDLIYDASQDESDEVKPSYPVDQEPTVPHVSIKYGTWDEIANHRQDFINGELVWCTDENRNCMYIYLNGTFKIVAGGGGGAVDPDNPGEDDMDKLQVQEIISESLDNIENGLTFIPADGNGIQYKLDVDKDGNIKVYNKKLDTPMKWPNSYMWASGYNSLVGLIINSFYVGGVDNDEHSYQPCSHNFVEISNMAQDKNTGKMIDINLNGFSLCYFDGQQWYECPLKGEIKGGGTYLVRGAQCSVMEANTTLLKVKTYDQEWFNTVETIEGETTVKKTLPMKFSQDAGSIYLVFTGPEHKFYKIDSTNAQVECGTTVQSLPKDSGTLWKDGVDSAKGYSDLVGYQRPGFSAVHYPKNAFKLDSLNAISKNPCSEVIFRRWYLMDPVTQSNPKDGITAHNNVKYMTATLLKGGTIPDYMDAAEWTPKASFEKKTIKQTRNHFGRYKGPGVLTCTFGCQATWKDAAHPATRGFCWVSDGYHDEYIKVRKENGTWYEFDSLTDIIADTANTPKDGIKYSPVHTSLNLYEYYTRERWESPYNESVTTHRVILTGFVKGVYEYQVCRRGDSEWKSKIRKFTVRTDADINANGFVFMQTTDQQGASWEEYEVWNLCARKIKQVCQDENSNKNSAGNVIPLNLSVPLNSYEFVINTGDICYNGSRSNEWLDYFDGYEPMDDREEMLCLGNNDLAPINMYDIGTGAESPWKINVKVIDTFYAVETPVDNPNVFVGTKAGDSAATSTFRMPGLYSFNYGKYHFICILSEIRTGSGKVEQTPVLDENGEQKRDEFGNLMFDKVEKALKSTTVSSIFGMEDSARLEKSTATGEKNTAARLIFDMQEAWIIKDLLKWRGASYDITKVDYKNINYYRQLPEIVGACQDCFIYTHEMPFNITSQSAYSSYGLSPGSVPRETAKAYLNRFHNFEYQRSFKLWGIRLVFGGHKHTVAMTRAVYDAPMHYNPITKRIELPDNITNANELIKDDIYELPVTGNKRDYIQYDYIDDNYKFKPTGTFSFIASFQPFVQLVDSDLGQGGHWEAIRTKCAEIYNNSSTAKTLTDAHGRSITIPSKQKHIISEVLPSSGEGTSLTNATIRVEIVDKTDAPYYVMCHATGFKNKSNSDLAASAEVIPWEYYYVNGNVTYDQCFPYCTLYVVKDGDDGKTQIEVNMLRITGIYPVPNNDVGTKAGYWDLMKIYNKSVSSLEVNRNNILDKTYMSLFSGAVKGDESGKAITIGRL